MIDNDVSIGNLYDTEHFKCKIIAPEITISIQQFAVNV